MSSATQIACGVIGLGTLGFIHAANLASKIENAKLIAIAARSEATLARARQNFNGVQLFSDYRDMLADPGLDAVIIAAPTKFHAQMAIEAIEAGKMVFCEKPGAFNLAEAEKLRQQCKKRAAFYQIGFNRRFDADYAAAKEKIASGLIGRVLFFKSSGRDPVPPSLETAKASGGIILDKCIHDIDLARWYLGGEITRIYAEGYILQYEYLQDAGDYDQVTLLLTSANGSTATLEGSRNGTYGYDLFSEIVGTKGAIKIGRQQSGYTTVFQQGQATIRTVAGFRERFGASYLAELQSFIHQALQGQEPLVTVEDCYQNLSIALAAQQACQIGAPLVI